MFLGLAVAVQELDGHVRTVLCKEADCLIAGLDSLHHVVSLGALLDVACFAQLSNLVVHNALSIDDLLELRESEVVIADLRYDIFVLVVVVSLVELRNSARLLHTGLVHDFFCAVVHFLIVHVLHLAACPGVGGADGALHRCAHTELSRGSAPLIDLI